MCYVTATELKQNLSHYLELSSKENVYITKNKKVIAVLSDPRAKAFENFLALEGCLADGDTGEDYDILIGEEVLKRCMR